RSKAPRNRWANAPLPAWCRPSRWSSSSTPWPRCGSCTWTGRRTARTMMAIQSHTTDRSAADMAIRVRGLVNRFGSQTVHEDLDLDVRRGEILGVVGGSGTGKSVLMRSILGLRKPDAGQMEVLGIDAR